jgi:hypothetical protein
MMFSGLGSADSSSAGDQSGMRSSAVAERGHQFLVQLREARDQFFAGGSLHCSLLGG